MGLTPDLQLLEFSDAVRRPLADGDWYLALRNPIEILDPRLESWRKAVTVSSSAAFGTDMSGIWAERYAGDFFASLHQFALVFDPEGNLVGSGGYRAKTIEGNRMVYFESSSVIPTHRGHGIVAQLQLDALSVESGHSGLPVYLVFRTRSPVAFSIALRRFADTVVPDLTGSVPPSIQDLFASTADWLGFAGCDPETGRVAGAYEGRPPLYPVGEEPVSTNEEANRVLSTLGPTDGLMLLIGPDAHLD